MTVTADVKRSQQLKLTEAQFTTQLIAWAQTFGWRCFHARTSGRMSNGRGIPTVQGDYGFPDLVLVKGQRLLFAELKVGKNKLTEQQQQWLSALAHVEVHVWRPEQWTEIVSILSKP